MEDDFGDIQECFDLEDDVNFEEEQNEEEEELIESVESIGSGYVSALAASFTEHQEAVMCCDVSADGKFIITGGVDDKAILWNSETLVSVFETSGHKDTVVAVGFNKDSSMVATGDMSGIVFVWSLSGKLLFDFSVEDINWMLWHNIAADILLAGTNTGEAWLWKLSASDPRCKTFQSFGSMNNTARIFSDGKRIAMGYEDGIVRIWDMKSTSIIHCVKGLLVHWLYHFCSNFSF